MNLSDLPTPAALVDLDVLEQNCERMANRAQALGARLRPHVKTHKCAEAGRVQVRSHFGGVTVSTLAEARGFIEGGFSDLIYAFPLPIARIPEVVELSQRVDHFGVLVDQAETIDALIRDGSRFEVLLKVDCGAHRAGVDPGSAEAIDLARRLAEAPTIDFRGILTHAGHSYAAVDRAGILRVAIEEREVMVAFADRLRAESIEVPEVSIGSTPTCAVTEDLTGITEIRPGNYAFFDLFQRAIGVCRTEDIAFSVLASVVAAYPARCEWILDAGALALSKDRGAAHVAGEWGYGLLLGADGRMLTDGAELGCAELSQEHGLVRARGKVDPSRLAVGDRVRVLPNHSCLAAAQFESFSVVRDGEIVDEWRPFRGW